LLVVSCFLHLLSAKTTEIYGLLKNGATSELKTKIEELDPSERMAVFCVPSDGFVVNIYYKVTVPEQVDILYDRGAPLECTETDDAQVHMVSAAIFSHRRLKTLELPPNVAVKIFNRILEKSSNLSFRSSSGMLFHLVPELLFDNRTATPLLLKALFDQKRVGINDQIKLSRMSPAERPIGFAVNYFRSSVNMSEKIRILMSYKPDLTASPGIKGPYSNYLEMMIYKLGFEYYAYSSLFECLVTFVKHLEGSIENITKGIDNVSKTAMAKNITRINDSTELLMFLTTPVMKSRLGTPHEKDIITWTLSYELSRKHRTDAEQLVEEVKKLEFPPSSSTEIDALLNARLKLLLIAEGIEPSLLPTYLDLIDLHRKLPDSSVQADVDSLFKQLCEQMDHDWGTKFVSEWNALTPNHQLTLPWKIVTIVFILLAMIISIVLVGLIAWYTKIKKPW
jgi:hypothetical protein